MAKKYYVLSIVDSDGDQHSYYFIASNPWIVTNYVLLVFAKDEDFYGHKAYQTQDIEVAEQFGSVAPNGIVEIELL